MSWRDRANKVINQVLAENKPQTEEEAKKLLREAYPFGERAMHPYKIWLSAVKQTLRRRFPKQADMEIGLFARSPEMNFDQDVDLPDEDNFQPCANCDQPDACADFGCAIKNGLRVDDNF